MPGFEVFGEEERKALNEIFDLNGGIMFAHSFDAVRNGVYRVREFEKAFSAYIGAPYAQAVSSGTSAIKVGLKALGVKPGDEVIVTCHTFVATVEAILECGARPVLVDINESMGIDAASIDKAVTPKSKVVVVVHMAGVPCQMDEIMAVARKHGLKVLEDTAQCCGGSYKGKKAGTIGDIGCFSFDGGKTLCCGEGGMVVTQDENLYIEARSYHDHGHEYSKTLGRGQEKALRTGFNYRMTEMQAAIGLVQLKKLDPVILANQVANTKKLKGLLKDLPFKFRPVPDFVGEIGDALIFFANSKEQAQAIVAKMVQAGLGTKNLPDAIRWHFARNWEHMFKEFNFYADTFQNEWAKSADILARAVALPIMVKMTDERLKETADKLLAIAKEV